MRVQRGNKEEEINQKELLDEQLESDAITDEQYGFEIGYFDY